MVLAGGSAGVVGGACDRGTGMKMSAALGGGGPALIPDPPGWGLPATATDIRDGQETQSHYGQFKIKKLYA